MDKIKPGSGHLDSSATHHVVQASTILDRRYVKRPSVTNAGKYSSAAPAHSNNVAPSRLINLGVHATDLEVAQIKEAIREEVDDASEPSTENYMTEDALALSLEVSEATSPGGIDIDDMEDCFAQDSSTNNDAYVNSYSDKSPVDFANDTTPAESIDSETEDSAPVSMYALEAMRQSMMQDLVSNTSASDSVDCNVEPRSPSENSTTNTEPASYPTYADPSAYTTSNYYDQSQYSNTSVITDYSVAPADPTTEPIDAISKATSDALASIRIATESSEVSDQMASLKAFADSIKSDSPEMAELGNTIEKFANVAMKSTKAKEEAENKVALSVNRSPRIVQSSARINRASTSHTPTSNMIATSSAQGSRPTLSRSPKIASINHTAKPATTTKRPISRSTTSTTKKSASRHAPDNRALEQALRSVATMDEENPTAKSKKTRSKVRRKGGFTRFALALGCAGACIAAIIYFVGSNIPDISVQVAAMQTGIDAAYPSYVPRDYSLGDIASEDGRLTMRFNGPNGSSFTLIEEKSSWDSSALQRNYVEPTWGDNFTTTHEQGITIFLSNSDAAWVNGGVLYKINSSSNDLTKKQLRNIVTSM